MRISEQGLTLLKQFEGFSAMPYRCPAGLMTIGYGHVIKAGESYPKEGISGQQAENLLKQDINQFEQGISRLVAVKISQNQFDAVLCLAYNIGIQVFEKSTLLRLLNQNQPERAAKEFEKWVFCRGRRLPGLITRRKAEANLYRQKPAFTEL